MGKLTLKRSAVPGKVPQAADLDFGELGMNTADGKLYFKKTVDGVDTVVDLSSAVDMTKIGGVPDSLQTIMDRGSLGGGTTIIATTETVQTTSLVNAIIFG